MTSNSLSLELAHWTLGLRYEDLPERVVADVKLRVLDTLGLVISGAGTPMGRAVHAASGSLGSGRRARLIPSGKRTSAPTAALAHGTQAHAEDFDDTHNESIMHSSAPVVATALALGEWVRASGREAIVLVAAGNELNCRLGCVAPGRFHDHGFHPTSVLGSITSAILAGRMLGLDASGAAHAAGIAGSQASGILEAYEDGTWSKTLHPGWAAHAGVTAGVLASAGFSGPLTVLEGRFGLYRSFLRGSGQSFDFDRVTAGLGDEWEQLDSSFKPYPCAHAIHSFVDAALEVRTSLGLRPARCLERSTGGLPRHHGGRISELLHALRPQHEPLAQHHPGDARSPDVLHPPGAGAARRVAGAGCARQRAAPVQRPAPGRLQGHFVDRRVHELVHPRRAGDQQLGRVREAYKARTARLDPEDFEATA